MHLLQYFDISQYSYFSVESSLISLVLRIPVQVLRSVPSTVLVFLLGVTTRMLHSVWSGWKLVFGFATLSVKGKKKPDFKFRYKFDFGDAIVAYIWDNMIGTPRIVNGVSPWYHEDIELCGPLLFSELVSEISIDNVDREAEIEGYGFFSSHNPHFSHYSLVKTWDSLFRSQSIGILGVPAKEEKQGSMTHLVAIELYKLQ